MRDDQACARASICVWVPANTGVSPGTAQRKRGSSPGPTVSIRMTLAERSWSSGTRCGLPRPAMAAVALGVLAAVVLALLVPRSRRAIVAAVRGARPGWWIVLFFLVVTAGGVCLQN